MKNFIFSYLWRSHGASTFNAATGTFIGRDIVDLYEHVQGQPENWAITHVAEIDDEQMERVAANGILG